GEKLELPKLFLRTRKRGRRRREIETRRRWRRRVGGGARRSLDRLADVERELHAGIEQGDVPVRQFRSVGSLQFCEARVIVASKRARRAAECVRALTIGGAVWAQHHGFFAGQERHGQPSANQ